MTERREDIADESKSRERFEKAAELIVANCACATQLEELRDEESDTYRTMVLNVISGLRSAERGTRERCAQIADKVMEERALNLSERKAVAEAIRKGGEGMNSEMVSIYRDGDHMCALIGQDLQEGIAGFGYTVGDALRDLATNVDNAGWTQL